jgi:catalase (peroxidase I)
MTSDDLMCSQWRPVLKPNADAEVEELPNIPDIMMFTSDVALLFDEAYLSLVQLYASNIAELGM